MDSVEKINQVIHGMESRIGEDNTRELEILLAGLNKEMKGNDPAVLVVKMMQSLAKYLSSRIKMAHPDTIPVLALLAGDLKTLVRIPPPSADESDKIIARCTRSFKALKSGVASVPLVSETEMEELKAVILSVDWEISSITLKGFGQVISRLKKKLKFNKIHYTFLRIMHSIGGHIAQHKAGAHKDSVALLRWVFQHYEQLVQNPDMSPEERKQMVERSIQAYNAFKRKIPAPPVPQVSPVPPAPPVVDEGMPPALSHVSSVRSTGKSAPLNKLPEPGEEVLPALGGKTKKEAPKRDVMGDLFSLKESPADELLDAIHLAEMHGPGQETAAGLPGTGADEVQKPGVKSFTPQSKGQDPIPEIENRLDAFFNLDLSETNEGDVTPANYQQLDEKTDTLPMESGADLVSGQRDALSQLIADVESPAEESPTEESPTEESSVEDVLGEEEISGEEIPEDGIELIVPEGDDAVLIGTEKPGEDDGYLEKPGTKSDTIMERMENALETPEGLVQDLVLKEVIEDISKLKFLWLDDPEKVRLLGLLSSLSQFIHDSEKKGQPAVQIVNDFSGNNGLADLSEDQDDVKDALTEVLVGAQLEEDSPEGETFLDDQNVRLHGEDLKEEFQEEADQEETEQEETEQETIAQKGFWAKIKSIFGK